MAATGSTIAPTGVITILQYTSDDSNDVLKNNLTLDKHEYVSSSTAATPKQLRGQLTEELNNGILNGIGVLDDKGHLYVFSALGSLKLSLAGVPNHADEDKFVGLLGDLLDGKYYDYFIQQEAFNPISNSINCLAADLIHTEAAAHLTGAGDFLQGPHQTADAGVTPTHTRKLFKIPFFLLQHFLAIPADADAGHIFWKDIYPLITAKNLATECKSLIDYFRVAVTKESATNDRPLVYLTAAQMPISVGRNPAVLKFREATLKRTFPSIFVDRVVASQNQHMSAMAASQDEANTIARESLQFQRDQANKRKLEKMQRAVGGTQQLNYLMAMLGVPNLASLPNIIRLLMEETSSDERDKILEREAHRIAKKLRLPAPPLMPKFVDRILKQSWHMEDDSKPETGSACNPLQWCNAKQMADEYKKKQALFNRANIKVTKEEQAVLEKAVVFFTHIDDFEVHLNHGYVLWLALTGENSNHPVVAFLKEYRGKVSANKTKIMAYPLRDPTNKDIMGLLIQIRLAKELEKYSRAIEDGTTPPALDHEMIIDTVWEETGNDTSWEAWSSTLGTIEFKFGDSLKIFRNAGRRSTSDTLRDELTVVGTQVGDVLKISGEGARLGTGGMSCFLDDVSQIPDEIPQTLPAPTRAATPQRAAANAAPARSRATRVENYNGDSELRRTWSELNKQCGTVKAAAKNGDHGVPPLPRSSVEGHHNDPMCLNWSTVLWCNRECSECYDHVEQPAEKKTELKQWVQEHASKVPNRQRQRRRRRGGNQGERD